MSMMHFVIGVGVGLLGFLLYGRLEQNNHRYQNSEQPRPPPRQPQSQQRRRSSSVEIVANQKPGDNCTVCLETMNAHNIRQLLCGHALHKTCYDDCIKNNRKTCPLCQQRMI